jgi:hypothetical protein
MEDNESFPASSKTFSTLMSTRAMHITLKAVISKFLHTIAEVLKEKVSL